VVPQKMRASCEARTLPNGIVSEVRLAVEILLRVALVAVVVWNKRRNELSAVHPDPECIPASRANYVK